MHLFMVLPPLLLCSPPQQRRRLPLLTQQQPNSLHTSSRRADKPLQSQLPQLTATPACGCPAHGSTASCRIAPCARAAPAVDTAHTNSCFARRKAQPTATTTSIRRSEVAAVGGQSHVATVQFTESWPCTSLQGNPPPRSSEKSCKPIERLSCAHPPSGQGQQPLWQEGRVALELQLAASCMQPSACSASEMTPSTTQPRCLKAQGKCTLPRTCRLDHI